MRTAKQVIVMRKDLNMRKGKMIAQGAHASLGAWKELCSDHNNYRSDIYEAATAWDEGTFTKICVGVDSRDELQNVLEAAILAGLPVKMILDTGLTEFNGVPTHTCLAIGPAWSDDIDKITGYLKLL